MELRGFKCEVLTMWLHVAYISNAEKSELTVNHNFLTV